MQENIIEIVEKAFTEHHITDLLRGNAPYIITPGKSAFASQPTDWSNLVRLGIIPYCISDTTGKRWEQLLETIKTMLDKDPIDIWCVYNIYFFLAYSSHGGKVSITGYTNFPKDKLHDALGQNKEELKKIKKWSGYNLPDGLWDDLCYADLALERRYPGCGIMFHRVEEEQ